MLSDTILKCRLPVLPNKYDISEFFHQRYICKIWIILPEFTGIIILQVTEHRTVPHSMSIYYRVFIRKILLIVNIQEDCSQRIFVRRKCFLQIFTVIRSLNNRIIDLTRLIRESDPCDRIRIDLQQFLKINRECIISVFTMILSLSFLFLSSVTASFRTLSYSLLPSR